MNGYKPFYIQKTSAEGAIDTTTWGLVAKTNPYPALPDPKECYVNDWKDEDGDDEYNATIHYKAMTISVTFYVKTYDTQTATAEAVMREQLDTFFNKIKNGEFAFYDSYTGLGRNRARYAGYKEESFLRREDWARSIFTITIKVNDPITRVTYSEGKLV